MDVVGEKNVATGGQVRFFHQALEVLDCDLAPFVIIFLIRIQSW
jgi:hypothetical protein